MYALSLNNESWETVKKPGASAEEYARALRQAERACALDPDNPHDLSTLGVARIRSGHPGEALETLWRSERLNARAPWPFRSSINLASWPWRTQQLSIPTTWGDRSSR